MVTDLAQQTQVEHGLLLLLIEGLRNTLAWKVSGADFARKQSTLRFITQSFQRHLERVLSLEEYDGYMDLVLKASPQLGNTVDALRKEHDQFRAEARRVLHRFEHVSAKDPDGFARTCDELSQLLARVEAHNKKEADLIQEAFARDEGGEG